MLSSDLEGKLGLALLRSTGEELVSEWSRLGSASPDGERFAGVVERLLGMAERLDEDGHEVALPASESDLHLFSRAMRELGSKLLRLRRDSQAPRDADPSEILSAIERLERVRLQLWPHGDEDLVQRFSEPDAFELLMEVGHDIRSPLSSILFLAETLRGGRSGELNELQRRQLGLIYSAALGLQSISNDVVDSARGPRWFMEESPAHFSVVELFDRIHEVVRPVAEEKGLSLEFRGPDRDRLVGHPMPLSRTLLNLTTNALKFTEVGGVIVSVSPVERTGMEFSVADSGRGMSGKQIEMLYQPFRKSEYRTGHFFSGSGLGLSIVRRFLAAMGSELHVDSEVGVGTRFWFRLDLPSRAL